MPSWQFRIIKIIFRIRRLFKPPTGILVVERSRAETEALAENFKTKVKLTCTPVFANEVPAEWIATPRTSAEKVILFLHGGSYISGSIKSHRSLTADIANEAKSRALLIDYRLAPEHPFPAAVEDALSAYNWLLDNQFSPAQIVIAGDSCGGGLALALLVSLRDEKKPLPAAAVCLSPWTDLTCTGESWKINSKKDILLDPGALRQSAQVYLRGTDPRNPLASPLFADLKKLPPLLIQVGSEELILSDATCFAEQARAAGVDVTLEVWERMQHEWHFTANMLPEGKQAIEHIGTFVESHL